MDETHHPAYNSPPHFDSTCPPLHLTPTAPTNATIVDVSASTDPLHYVYSPCCRTPSESECHDCIGPTTTTTENPGFDPNNSYLAPFVSTAVRDVSRQLLQTYRNSSQPTLPSASAERQETSGSRYVSGCGAQFGKTGIDQPSGYPTEVAEDW